MQVNLKKIIAFSISFSVEAYTGKIRRSVQCQGEEFLFIVPGYGKIEEKAISFIRHIPLRIVLEFV